MDFSNHTSMSVTSRIFEAALKHLDPAKLLEVLAERLPAAQVVEIIRDYDENILPTPTEAEQVLINEIVDRFDRLSATTQQILLVIFGDVKKPEAP